MEYLLCIKKNGESYCWDSELERFEKVIREPVDISDVPESVVFEFVRKFGRDIKANKEG